MPVIVMHFIDHRAVTPFVGFTVNMTAFESAPRDPHAESVGVVITSPFFASASFSAARGDGPFHRPSERRWLSSRPRC